MYYPSEFMRAVDFTLRQEGLLSDHPSDKGGLTKFGITQATWSARHGGSVANITVDDAINVYYNTFWRDDLPREIQLPYFDFAVHSGPGVAAKALQRILGAEQDGDIGPLTLGKMAALQGSMLRKLRNDYVTARLVFLADLVQRKTDNVAFIEGWVRRATKLYDFAY